MASGIWWPKEPAPRGAIETLRASAPIRLPRPYLRYLESSNGAEGDLGVQPGWIALWRAEDVLELNDGYKVQESLPGFFGFGSNGAGELFAFDVRGEMPYPIVMVPFIGMTLEDVVRIAASFDELVAQFGLPMAED
jgi:hypothetical protein